MISDSPKFSVIVPSYNVEKTLIPTLDSIADQIYRNFETIVVDDGSIDNTYEIASNYSRDINIRIVKQRNKGLGGARNSGIEKSKGKYIAFLDADDIWMSNKLSKVNDVLKDESVDLVCHDEYVMQGENILNVHRYGPYSSLYDLLFIGNCLSPSAVVVKKKIIEKVGGFSTDRKFHGVEDYDLWMKIAIIESNFKYLHELLGVYMIHGQNMIFDSDFRDRELNLKEVYYNDLCKNIRFHPVIKASREIDKARNILINMERSKKLNNLSVAIYYILKNVHRLFVLRLLAGKAVKYLRSLYYKSIGSRKIL